MTCRWCRARRRTRQRAERGQLRGERSTERQDMFSLLVRSSHSQCDARRTTLGCQSVTDPRHFTPTATDLSQCHSTEIRKQYDKQQGYIVLYTSNG